MIKLYYEPTPSVWIEETCEAGVKRFRSMGHPYYYTIRGKSAQRLTNEVRPTLNEALDVLGPPKENMTVRVYDNGGYFRVGEKSYFGPEQAIQELRDRGGSKNLRKASTIPTGIDEYNEEWFWWVKND